MSASVEERLGFNDPARMDAVTTQLQGIALLPASFDDKPAYTNSFMQS